MKMLSNDTHKFLDRGFIAFAAMFSKYVTKGILDMRAVGCGKRESSSYDSDGFMQSLSGTDLATDADSSGSHLFLAPRLRTGLQKTLQSNYALVVLCCTYPIALGVFWNFFDTVQLDGDHVLELGKCRY